MRLGTLIVLGSASGAALGHGLGAPFPAWGENAWLDLIAAYDPRLHSVIRGWPYAAPAVCVVLGGSLCLSVWRVWRQPLARIGRRGKLPRWPASPERPGALARDRGAPPSHGSGKTSACLYPFAELLLSWQAGRPGRRASALVLEVKGDFCHAVRRTLTEAGRGDDYLEIGLGGSWQRNPLDDPLLDSYSLAYGVASLINQLFGKSREPFQLPGLDGGAHRHAARGPQQGGGRLRPLGPVRAPPRPDGAVGGVPGWRASTRVGRFPAAGGRSVEARSEADPRLAPDPLRVRSQHTQ